MAKDNKTNAMRKLDSMKIEYKEHYYTDTDAVSGVDTAAALGEDPERVFKTLVTVGKSALENTTTSYPMKRRFVGSEISGCMTGLPFSSS